MSEHEIQLATEQANKDVTPEVAPADLGPDAAQGQSAELTSPEAKAEAEKKRKAAVQKSWEGALGETIGSKLYEAISDHVSYDGLLGYAMDGAESLGDALKDGPVKDDVIEGADAANKLIAALAPAIQAQAEKWIEGETGQKVIQSISGWVEGHPKTIATLIGVAAIGAAVAAWVSNMNPKEFSKSFKLGKGFTGKAGLDIGPLQDLTVEAASLALEYEREHFKAAISGTYDAKKGNSAKASAEYKNGGTTAAVDGTWNDKDGAAGSASVDYKKDGLDVGVAAAHSEKDGTTAKAHASVEGETRMGKADASADATLDKDGQVTVNLHGGLAGKVGGNDFAVGVDHSTGKEKNTTVNGRITLNQQGLVKEVTGSMDANGAFKFGLDQTSLDGLTKSSHTVGQDADGKKTQEMSLEQQLSETQSISFGAAGGAAGQSAELSYADTDFLGTGAGLDAKAQMGDKKGYSLGLDYDIGAFKTELDLAMDDSVTTLGLGTSGHLTDEITTSADLKYNLTDSRLDEIGVKIGWKDPDAFRSFTTEYRAEWDSKTGGYDHSFDTALEYASGDLAGRLKLGANTKGSDFSGANADLLMGYQVNKDWAVLAGGSYGVSQDQNNNFQNNTAARVGVEYKGVAVTVNHDFNTNEQKIMLEIPLFSW